MNSMKKYIVLVFIVFYIFSDQGYFAVKDNGQDEEEKKFEVCEDIIKAIYSKSDTETLKPDGHADIHDIVVYVIKYVKVSDITGETRDFLDYVFSAIEIFQVYDTHIYCNDKNTTGLTAKDCINELAKLGFKNKWSDNVRLLYYESTFGTEENKIFKAYGIYEVSQLRINYDKLDKGKTLTEYCYKKYEGENSRINAYRKIIQTIYKDFNGEPFKPHRQIETHELVVYIIDNVKVSEISGEARQFLDYVFKALEISLYYDTPSFCQKNIEELALLQESVDEKNERVKGCESQLAKDGFTNDDQQSIWYNSEKILQRLFYDWKSDMAKNDTVKKFVLYLSMHLTLKLDYLNSGKNLDEYCTIVARQKMAEEEEEMARQKMAEEEMSKMARQKMAEEEMSKNARKKRNVFSRMKDKMKNIIFCLKGDMDTKEKMSP